SGKPLLERIGRPAFSDTVYDVPALMEPVDHFLDHVDVVLEVGVDTDDGVAVGLEQTSQEGVLMAAVAAQLDAHDGHLTLYERLHDLPSAIAAAVVDKIDPALLRYLSGRDQPREQRRQAAR